MNKIICPLLFCSVVVSPIFAGSQPAVAQGHHGKPAKTRQPKIYRNVRGQVVAVIKAKRAGEKTAVVVDHEDIPKFMRAMQMTLPLQNPADARNLRKGAKIRFDMILKDGTFLVGNIKALPAHTRLKLAPA